MVLSYPELPRDVLESRPFARKLVCRTFSDCTTAPRNGLVAGCYALDPFYRERDEAARLGDEEAQGLGVETGDVWAGTYRAGLVDPREPTPVRPVPGLSIPSWSGTGELFGGAFGDDGRIEYARLDVTGGVPGDVALTGVDVDDVEDADASSSADRSVRSTSADIRS